MSLSIPNFLEEIASLSHSIAFISLHVFLERLSYLSFLFFGTLHSSFSPLHFVFLLPLLFVRNPQTDILPFCIYFSRGFFWSTCSVQCYKPPSIGLHEEMITWGFELGGYLVIHINMQVHNPSKAQWNHSKEIKDRRKETNKKGENRWRDHGNSVSESGEERKEWSLISKPARPWVIVVSGSSKNPNSSCCC